MGREASAERTFGFSQPQLPAGEAFVRVVLTTAVCLVSLCQVLSGVSVMFCRQIQVAVDKNIRHQERGTRCAACGPIFVPV